MSEQDGERIADGPSPDPELVRISDLGALRRIEDPRISPDGRQVACLLREIDLEGNAYRTSIHLFDAEGGRGRRLTAGPRDAAPRWSPDGRQIAFERRPEEGKPQVHVIAIDGGEARPITAMKLGARAARLSPDGRWLAFLSPSSELERQVEDRLPTDDQAMADELTERAEEASRQDPRVIERLPYRSGTRYIEREDHIYVVELPELDGEGLAPPGSARPEGPPRPRRLTGGEGSYAIADWSSDGQWIYGWGLIDYDANDRFGAGEVLAFPARDGAPRRLSREDERCGMPLPSPCGRYLAWTRSPKDRSFSIGNHLVVVEIGQVLEVSADGDDPAHLPCELPAVATSAAFDRVVEGFAWSSEGDALILRCPDRGAMRLFRFDLAAALDAADTLEIDLDDRAWPRPDERPEVAHVEPIGAFDHADRYVTACDVAGCRLAACVSSPSHPADLFTLALDPKGRTAEGAEPQRLTAVAGSYLASRTLARTEEIWFDAPDGHPVQGWLIRLPIESEAGRPVPLILEIHGGPHSMWGPGEPSMWHEFQALAARGNAIFYCNPRGSDGYGRRHRLAIHNRWGLAEEGDFLAGLDAALARGGLDGQRVGVTGGSYGGYMTAWLIGRHQRFRAAVSQRGVYDLVSFAGTTDIPTFTEQIFETGFWKEPERLWRHSPLAHVADIRTPLLILHAEQDYRVPIAGAEQLFAALKRLGRVVRLVRYPREGHELSRSGEPKHRVDRLERMLAWFDEHL